MTSIIEPLNFQKEQNFLPESMSSYAGKSVFAVMQGMTQLRNYRYREAVLNPTNPEDLPTELERRSFNASSPTLSFRRLVAMTSIRFFHFTIEGLQKNRTAASTRILPSSDGKASLTHVYTATSESAISSCQMALSTFKRAPVLCQS
ncbi:MAG: DUF3365 domain-containing protein [Synechococcaceae cyanobacterium]